MSMFVGDSKKPASSNEEPELSTTEQATRATDLLSKANSVAVVLNCLGSALAILSGFAQVFDNDEGPGWLFVCIGLAYLVSSILVYLIIEAFAANVRVNAETLLELQKANKKQ